MFQDIEDETLFIIFPIVLGLLYGFFCPKEAILVLVGQ